MVFEQLSSACFLQLVCIVDIGNTRRAARTVLVSFCFSLFFSHPAADRALESVLSKSMSVNTGKMVNIA